MFEICLQQIQIAVTRARARGETRCTEQFLIEAFHEESPSLETAVVLGVDLAKPGSDITAYRCLGCDAQWIDGEKPQHAFGCGQG